MDSRWSCMLYIFYDTFFYALFVTFNICKSKIEFIIFSKIFVFHLWSGYLSFTGGLPFLKNFYNFWILNFWKYLVESEILNSCYIYTKVFYSLRLSSISSDFNGIEITIPWQIQIHKQLKDTLGTKKLNDF